MCVQGWLHIRHTKKKPSYEGLISQTLAGNGVFGL